MISPPGVWCCFSRLLLFRRALSHFRAGGAAFSSSFFLRGCPCLLCGCCFHSLFLEWCCFPPPSPFVGGAANPFWCGVSPLPWCCFLVPPLWRCCSPAPPPLVCCCAPPLCLPPRPFSCAALSLSLVGGAPFSLLLLLRGAVLFLLLLLLCGAVSLIGFWVVLGTYEFGRSRTTGNPNAPFGWCSFPSSLFSGGAAVGGVAVSSWVVLFSPSSWVVVLLCPSSFVGELLPRSLCTTK